MSSKLPQHAVNIGDIDVYFDVHFVQITVDGETVIFVPRQEENGLLQLATTLSSLVIKGEQK